jgi:hypothetical protein
MSEAQALTKLKNAGLLLHSFGLNSPYPNGYAIGKPKSILGNRRKDYEVYFGDEDILCDAPCSRLYPKENKWIFELREWTPGPGPGDFKIEFASIDETVSAVIEYYFGDPSQMNPPELFKL